MTRGGRRPEREGPERRCIVSGAVGPRARLVRFVIGPGHEVVPDVAGRLPGRGIYVTADRVLIERAAARGGFARAARMPVVVPEGLADLVETLLARRVVDLVSIARKAGDAVTGFERVKDWLASGRAVVLIQASDGSPRERARLRPPEGSPGGSVGAVTCLDAGEIGLAFGRERAIHAALAAGALAARVVDEAARLAGFRAAQAAGGVIAGKDAKNG